MMFFDDMNAGDVFEIGSFTFDAAGIKSFAERYDPQAFHLDEEAAARSHFGALCASGWQTAAVWMRLMVDYRRRAAEEMRRRGERAPEAGPGAGLKNLKWLKPVYAGDTVSYRTEVTGKRESKSRAGWGLVSFATTGTNQNGMVVYSFECTELVQRRPG